MIYRHCWPVLLVLLLAALGATEPAVRWRDGRFVAADGQPVVLRGVNLGCWLLLEPWMMRIDGVRDQEDLVRRWTAAHGAAWTADFRQRLRTAWLRAEDLEVVRACGFNTVRIPFDSRPLIAEQGPQVVDPAGFSGLDAAVALAEQAGLWIILDLHGAPGGQNDDQPTGERGRNNLWSDVDAQQRSALLWRAVAERYRDHPLVIAYDLVNEPYGADEDRNAAAIAVMDRLVTAVRAVDAERLIFIPGTSAGFRFYGRPADRGWSGCGFTEHYYPGLYGQPETVATHQAFLARQVPLINAEVTALGVPFLVGEFNPVVASAGAPASTRAHFDAYRANGWAATLWSLRWLSRKGGNGASDWCIIANRDPLPAIDARSASTAEWEAWLAVVAGPRAVNGAMVEAFASAQPPAFPRGDPPPLAAVPSAEPPAGWFANDIGLAASGGQEVLPGGGRWRMVSAGRELLQHHDAFRFLHRPAPAAAWTMTVTLEQLEAVNAHTKGGLMVRQGLGERAPFACVHALPDGRARFIAAPRADRRASETPPQAVGLPMELRLVLADGVVVGEARSRDGAWVGLGSMPWTAADIDRCGLALCSHDRRIPAAMVTSEVELR